MKPVLALIFCAAVAACGPAEAKKPIIIKFPHVVSDKSPKGMAALKFKQRAEELLEGKVEVQVYPNSQLMGDDESLEALATGNIQMIALPRPRFDRLPRKLQPFARPS